MKNISIEDLKNQPLLISAFKEQQNLLHIKRVIMNRKYKSKGNWSEEQIRAELISFGFIID